MKTRFLHNNFNAKSWQPRLVAEVYSDALIRNFQAIRQLVPGHELLPMVKANAYGHDAEWVGRHLCGLSGLYGMGVATLEEGARLRVGLGAAGRRTRIFVFSGATPWTDEKGHFCQKNGLIPIITSDEDWKRFFAGNWPEKIDYQLKFNTGMNRLGLHVATAADVVRALKSKPASWHPAGVLSHLAMGETPQDPLSRSQKERFVAVRDLFSCLSPSIRFHLANSAGIWNYRQWGLKGLTNVARPGLSLYGIPPFPKAPRHGIYPVMTVKAYVVARHRLGPGESLGYGGTFSVPPKGKTVHVAILAAGYADGIHRALSNLGKVWIGGRSTKYLGTVAMDLCAAECPSTTQVGEWAELMGPHTDLWAQAREAGTIPYELLTSVSGRVQRIYV